MKKLLQILLIGCICILTAFSFVSCDTVNANVNKNTDTPKEPTQTPAQHEHQYGEWYTLINATCTKTGIAQRDCIHENCNESQTQVIAIDPNNHQYQECITKSPSCTEDGLKTFTCECGESYTETITKTGHTYKVIEVIAPTCTTDGYTLERCDCNEERHTNYIPATNHDYEITSENPATCTQPGSRTKTCKNPNCGDSNTEIIEATGHSITDGTHKCSKCHHSIPDMDDLANSYWYYAEKGWAIFINDEGTSYISYKGNLDENGNFVKSSDTTYNYHGNLTTTKYSENDIRIEFVDKNLKREGD